MTFEEMLKKHTRAIMAGIEYDAINPRWSLRERIIGFLRTGRWRQQPPPFNPAIHMVQNPARLKAYDYDYVPQEALPFCNKKWTTASAGWGVLP